jgi:5-methylcytosine-specific restriction enzyme A
MALPDITHESVLLAIKEYDAVGREAFLTKHGFGKARGYLLRRDGKLYDSKAIAGVAHGYLAGQHALSSKDFSGGEQTVKKVLTDLGFDVDDRSFVDIPVPGEVLSNDEVTKRFRVGNSGGMRRNLDANVLVIFSDPFKGLYQDRWDGETLHYTGMGRIGDQVLEGNQNSTLFHSRSNGVAVYLFEALEPQKHTYVGRVELEAEPYQEEQLDDEQAPRKVWMFPLRPLYGAKPPEPTDIQARAITEHQIKQLRKLTTAQLIERAMKSKAKPSRRTTRTSAYVRDTSVAECAKRLADGKCDLCEALAPFRTKDDEAYLECHHIVWLAHGGLDVLENTVALCPNCHRKMHIVNGNADRSKLLKRIVSRDTSS